jgi:Fibronectin type III domain
MKWDKAATETDEIIDGIQMAHEVSGLKPDTEYKFQVVIMLRDLDNTLMSHIATVRTPSGSAVVMPPVISIDAGLAVSQVNSTWIKVSWRKFSDYELQFIDGVQIRYKERDSQVYKTTPLIHRLVDAYMLENLSPGTEYEVNILFLPYHGQETELQAERSVQATTAPALGEFFNSRSSGLGIKLRFFFFAS